MTKRINEEAFITTSGGSDLVVRRNPRRKGAFFSTDAGAVRVFIDRPLIGGNFGLEITPANSPYWIGEEQIGISMTGEIRCVAGPGVRLSYFGVTGE